VVFTAFTAGGPRRRRGHRGGSGAVLALGKVMIARLHSIARIVRVTPGLSASSSAYGGRFCRVAGSTLYS
jgi:hypothetical protein